MKKTVKKIVIVLVLVIVALVGTIGFTWKDEIASVASFHKIRERNASHGDANVYEMTMAGDYYIDKFVEQGGVSSDAELIDFVIGNITKGVVDISMPTPQIGCSSFTASTAAGDALFARNYDMHTTHAAIVHTSASGDRHATVSTVDLGLLGMDAESEVDGLKDRLTCLAAVYAPLDGMNDAGVSCGVYMTYQGPEGEVTATNQDTDKPDMTTTTFLRLVLDYADDLDEAVEIAQSYDMHDSAGTSYHYMVADASGRSAIFEWVAADDDTDTDGSARELRVTYNDDDAAFGEVEAAADYQWVTNFVLEPNYYASDDAKKGLDRYNELYTRLSATAGVVADESAAMDVLAAVGRRSWNNDDTNTITVHSVVYNLTDRVMYWVPNENFDDASAWITYKL